MKIEIGSTGIKGAAMVSGFSEREIRYLINRERLFPDMNRRQGITLTFKIQELFILGMVKALISASFSIRSACDAARGQQMYGALIRGKEISLAVGKGRRLTDIQGSHIAVSIVIRPWPLFDSMKPGLKKIFGREAVDELEQRKYGNV